MTTDSTALSRKEKIILFALVSTHVAMLWTAFDRYPLLPVVGDGPLIQDAALAMSRGLGTIAPSFSGTLNFESLYAHHPPIYLSLQAAIYYLFGLSPLTLRGLSLIAGTTYAVINIACVFTASRLQLLPRPLALPFSALILFEPATWYISRTERMDTLSLTFTSVGFLLLLKASAIELSATQRRRLVLFSALMVGAGISTHIGSTVPYIFLTLWLFAFRQVFGQRNIITFLLVPPIVWIMFWLSTYGHTSWEAFRQLLTIIKSRQEGQFGSFTSTFLNNPTTRGFLQIAPVAAVIGLSSWAIGISRLIFSPPPPHSSTTETITPAHFKPFLFALTGTLLIIILTADSERRLIPLLPYALISAGAFLNNSSRILNTTTQLLTIILSIGSAAIISSLIFKALWQWEKRDPNRFDPLIETIPQQASVVADAQLWFAFQKRNQNIRVVTPGFRPDVEFWESNHDALNDYDFVILSPGSTLANRAAYDRTVRSMTIGDTSFNIYRAATARHTP